MSTGPNSNTSIIDFAKELLFEMRFGRDEKRQSLDIGNVISHVWKVDLPLD